ncbi:MAG TPA: hypothetical protein VI386_22650 [Candidatus Sulfotelmatobacter sp.]
MLEKWLSGIIKNALRPTEDLVAKLHVHVTQESDALKNTVTSEMAAMKQHVSQEVDRPTETLKQHISSEISKRYDAILQHTAQAARESLADARKTLRMPCEVCGLMSWKFTVNPEGKIICHDCQIKGAK